MAATKHILVIQNNEDFQYLYRLLAKTAGFELETVYNWDEAPQRLENGAIPSLILLDNPLSTADGEETLITVRASKKWADLQGYCR